MSVKLVVDNTKLTVTYLEEAPAGMQQVAQQLVAASASSGGSFTEEHARRWPRTFEGYLHSEQTAPSLRAQLRKVKLPEDRPAMPYTYAAHQARNAWLGIGLIVALELAAVWLLLFRR